MSRPGAGGGPVPVRRRALLSVASAGVLLAAADTYVVVLALTSIIGDIGIPIDQLQRAAPIVSGFLLGYVAVLPLLGRLSDLHGRQPIFLGCLAIFAAGSLVTASAHDLPVVVAGRTLQGLGGGGLVPVALALVADHWAPGQRGLPLGLVGAAQELGSVLGPLYGAVIITLWSWRTIFWINLPLAAGLAAAYVLLARGGRRASRRGAPGRRDLVGWGLAALALLAGLAAIVAPDPLVESYTLGVLYTHLGGLAWATPVSLTGLVALLALLLWEALLPRQVAPLLPIRRLSTLLRSADWTAALLLALVLAVIVLVFSTADPAHQALAADSVWLLPVGALLALLLVLRERHAPQPLIPVAALADRAAVGALLSNLVIGAALIAALVDIPIFARETQFHDSQVGAAFVLLRLLAAVPLGALAGGAICERAGYRATAAGGLVLSAAMFMAMTGWTADSLSQPLVGLGWLHPADLALAGCGFGFGLAIAPVNAAILGAVEASLHGLASALVVVARSIGMLVGLSVLTAIGLHYFYVAAAAIASPLRLCPEHPSHCPAYEAQVTTAVITELHSIFAAAAVCALAAAAVAGLTLRRARGAALG